MMKTLLKARQRVVAFPTGVYRALIPAAILCARRHNLDLSHGLDRLQPPGATVGPQKFYDTLIWECLQKNLHNLWFVTLEIKGIRTTTIPFWPGLQRPTIFQVSPREWRYTEDEYSLPEPDIGINSKAFGSFVRRTKATAKAFDDINWLIPDPPAAYVEACWSNGLLSPIPETVAQILEAYTGATRMGCELEFHEGGM